MFDIFGLFGWDYKIRKLRKRWDRCREKSLKKKNPERKILLEKLDGIETQLRPLEEQQLNRASKAKMAKEVEINLEEVKEILKAKDEELVIKQ